MERKSEIGNQSIFNLEAEQSILGSCLIDKESVFLSMEELKPEDFHKKDNQVIFQAICNLFNLDQPIDVITVKEELNKMKKYESIGGIKYLSYLTDIVPTTSNIDRYIKIVKEKAIKRNLILIANEIIDNGNDNSVLTEELLELAEKKIFDISNGSIKKSYRHIRDIMFDSIQELEYMTKNKRKITGISTGFYDLDRKISGLKKSNLIILAARPGMGKSALAVNIAVNVAKHENKGVAIFNLEMKDTEINNRILSSEANVSNDKILNGNLDEDDWVKIATALGIVSDLPIYIDDTSGLTIGEIRAKCRKLKIEQNIGLIIIDYLQLITPNSKKNSTRENEVAEISRALKILAKELEVPVIALSQLSRTNEKGSGKVREPQLSDLRDSGAIEQDADIVLFIHRQGYYDKTNINNAKVIVAKNRSGSMGDVDLFWLGEYTKFVNIDKCYD